MDKLSVKLVWANTKLKSIVLGFKKNPAAKLVKWDPLQSVLPYSLLVTLILGNYHLMSGHPNNCTDIAQNALQR